MLFPRRFSVSPASRGVKAAKVFLSLFSLGFIAFAQLVETRFSINEDGVVSLSYYGSDEAYYTVYRGETLEGVFTLKDIALGEAKLINYNDSIIPNQSVFYRIDEVSLRQPRDMDGDGIDDAFELLYPSLLNPLDASDADLDPDEDGASNFEEYVRGTDPSAVGNIAPVVNLMMPKSGEGYASPGTINLLAVAEDPDGAITLVEFFEGNTKIGEATSAPHAFVWEGVAPGEYVITARATDDSGSSISTFGSVISVIDSAGADPTQVVDISPSNGEEGVAITRETIIRLSKPLASDAAIDSSVVSAIFGGEGLAARYALSADRKTVTIFYDETLPPSAKISVSFDGSQVTDLLGRLIDGDGDGVDGGVLNFSFNTLSVTSLANTSVCGRVFASELAPGNSGDSINVPLAGVKITVDGREDELFAFTDQFGDFRLENAPAGRFFVHIDGREVERVDEGIRFPDMAYYPFVGKTWESTPGEEVNIGEVYLPLVNGAALQDVSGEVATLIEFPLEVIRNNPLLKDVRMEVPADSLFSDDGTRGGRVGIAPVSPDRLPGTLPSNLSSALVITVQTDGATNFDVPAPICFPNLPDPETGEFLEPGESTALVSFNHDTGRWEVAGSMTVSEDGTMVCTDPGVGIIAPGWHTVGQETTGEEGEEKEKEKKKKKKPESTTTQRCATGDCPCDASCESSDKVFLHNGEEELQRTDLHIPGRGELDFTMRRWYRSQLDYDGPLGFGWSFNYLEGLYFEDNGDITRASGSAYGDKWELQSDGSYKAPTGHFRTLMRMEDGNYVLREANGFRRFYDEDGYLYCYQDRFDNVMLFDYDPDGNLSAVIDVFGREIDFVFESFSDGTDRLVKIRDFIGREVVYSYDENGDLVSVRSPVVHGTSTGNDFPEGRTERYTYSSGFDEPELNHNLLSCTMPEEVANDGPPAMQWTYGNDPGDPLTFDKVVSETIGGTNASGIAAGGTRLFTYEKLNESEPMGQLDLPRGKATITERNGNVMEYFVNEMQHHILTRQLTRGLREEEPDGYDTRSYFNEDGLLERRVFPEGNEVRYVYDSDGPRHMQQNTIEVRTVADVDRGGGEDLVTTYTYEPLFNQISSITDPRGNSSLYAPPLGEVSPERYTSRYFYDYQESSDSVEIAELFEIDISGVLRGQGDLNGDGRTDQVYGYKVREEGPSVLLRSDSNQAILSGTTEQSIITEYQWNDNGQRLAKIDEGGNVTEYHYHPENDPDGDGDNTFSPYLSLGSEPKGYLAEIVADSRLSPRRDASIDPVTLRSRFSYDPVGNIISTLDPRGIYSEIEINQLNEVVTITRGAAISSAVASQSLVTGESAFAYLTRKTYDHNGRVVLTEVENRDSNTEGVGNFVEQSFTYDILDNLIRSESEVDAQTSVVVEHRYDESENLTLTRQPEGNEVAAVYDERDLTFEVTHGVGSTEESTYSIDYDYNGNQIRITDAEDNSGDGKPESLLYNYDGFDRISEIIDALGNRSTIFYDVASNILRTQVFGHPAGLPDADNVLHRDTHYFYDELNRRYRTDGSLFIADGFGTTRSISLLDENSDGLVTNFREYDALSRVTHLVEDDGEITESVYDGFSRVVGVSDMLGNQIFTDYDENSNPIRVLGIEVSEEGLVLPEEFETNYVYDQLNRLVRATDNAGQTTRFDYDSRDNLISISDPVGTLTNDPLGLIPKLINRNGNTNTYIYDGLNRRIAEIRDLRVDGSGSSSIDFSNSYNPDGEVSLKYVFDDNSRLTGIVDDNGNRTTFLYDELNRRIQEINAKTDEFTTWDYDRDSNIRTVTDPNGTVISRSFDALNRVTGTSIARGDGVSGTTAETFAYDGLSRLTLTIDDNGEGVDQTCEYVYDSLSRVLEERFNAEVVSNVYTGDSKRVQCIYPSGRVIQQSFDRIDRVKTISDITTGSPNLIVASDWIGPDSRELFRQNGNNTNLSFISGNESVYDAVKRITRLSVTGPGNDLVVDREYGYNRANKLTFERRLDDNGLTDFFTHDSLYRIVDTTLDQSGSGNPRDLQEIRYTYDGVGNRREVSETIISAGTDTKIYTVNDVNEYTSKDEVARTHSLNGNLTSDGTQKFGYDYKNRLVDVFRVSDSTLVASYLYYADNRRAKKTVYGNPNVETMFFYDGWRVCEESSTDSGAITWVYSPVYIDAPVQMVTESAVFYLHQNVRADVVAVTDSSGSVIERRYYDDFGRSFDNAKQPVFGSSIGNPYGFQGRRLDEETGLYYFRNRYFSPETGRFLQRDPIWDARNVGGQYSFVGNGPTSGGDPLGLDIFDWYNDWVGYTGNVSGVLRPLEGDLKSLDLPSAWLSDLRKTDVEVFKYSGGATNWSGGKYQPGLNDLTYSASMFTKNNKIKGLESIAKNNPSQAAVIVQEAFHAWYDNVKGGGTLCNYDDDIDEDREEALSAYLQGLLEGWLKWRGQPAKDVNFMWPRILKDAASTAQASYPKARWGLEPKLMTFKETIDWFKREFGDFETPPPSKEDLLAAAKKKKNTGKKSKPAVSPKNQAFKDKIGQDYVNKKFGLSPSNRDRPRGK